MCLLSTLFVVLGGIRRNNMLFSDCNKQNMSQQSDLTREHGISLFCMCLGFKCMIFYPAIVCIPICINL